MCCLGVRCDVDDPDAWRWIEMSDRWQWHGQSGSAPTEVMIHFELDEVGIRGDGHTWIIGGEEFVQLATANDQAHITHAMIADALTDYFGLPPYVPVDPS